MQNHPCLSTCKLCVTIFKTIYWNSLLWRNAIRSTLFNSEQSVYRISIEIKASKERKNYFFFVSERTWKKYNQNNNNIQYTYTKKYHNNNKNVEKESTREKNLNELCNIARVRTENKFSLWNKYNQEQQKNKNK